MQFATFNNLPCSEFEALWLVRQLLHSVEQPQELEATSDGQASYQNRFIARPWQVAFLPEWYERRPEIAGYQTVIVAGSKGQEIYTDELHQNVAVKINMEAGSGITLKAGGSYVTISPSGVQMVAPAIALNGGASPLVGSDLNLLEALKPIGAVVHAARQQKAAATKICPYRKK